MALRSFILAALSLSLAAPPTASAKPPADIRAAEDVAIRRLERLADRLAAQDRFSGAVLVARGGRPVFQRSYGFADRERRRGVRADTAFHLGSASKMFTATAILQLVAAKKLTLDTKVGEILRDYPNREVAAKVTVRHLLTHSGGTGDIDIFGPGFTANRARARELSDFIALHGSRAPEFEPGSRQSYSNYGFILLGLIVERISGLSYRDYVARHIFAPAGMTNSGFPTRDTEEPRLAVGYTRMWPDFGKLGPLQRNRESLPWRGSSAGGGVASAPDLLRFVSALNSGKLVPPPLFADAIRPHLHKRALGFDTGGTGADFHWGHGGGAWGMSSSIRTYPARGMTLIVLANRDPNAAQELGAYFQYSLGDPEGAIPLFLRGSMNKWSTAAPLTRNGPGAYGIDIELEAGEHEFQLASEDWSTLAIGAPMGRAVIVDEAAEYPLGLGENIALKVSRKGRFRIALSGVIEGEPALSVRRLPG